MRLTHAEVACVHMYNTCVHMYAPHVSAFTCVSTHVSVAHVDTCAYSVVHMTPDTCTITCGHMQYYMWTHASAACVTRMLACMWTHAKMHVSTCNFYVCHAHVSANTRLDVCHAHVPVTSNACVHMIYYMCPHVTQACVTRMCHLQI